MGKLAVACNDRVISNPNPKPPNPSDHGYLVITPLYLLGNDRVISFYELHDHGGMQRWAVHP